MAMRRRVLARKSVHRHRAAKTQGKVAQVQTSDMPGAVEVEAARGSWAANDAAVTASMPSLQTVMWVVV